jgi:hypothetical protein
MKNSQKGYKFTACGIPIRRIDSSLLAQRKAILAGNAERKFICLIKKVLLPALADGASYQKVWQANDFIK